MYFTSVLKLVY